MNQKNIAVIGGGINGLAVARQFMLDHPDTRVTVFEKESAVARHQSGHNSGVVHAGLYYEPGSLKARLCRRGVEMVQDYCREHSLPYDECGKVVVALNERELPRLEAIYSKALANGVPEVKMVGPEELHEIEPNCVGIRALHSPHTAIVSYGDITACMAREIEAGGAEMRLNTPVQCLTERSDGVHVTLAHGGMHGQVFDQVITCCGLQSDRLARRSGDTPNPHIVPFFGQYYVIDSAFRRHVRGLIYPVPDPRFPFLGVHFTKRIDGQMTIGPNAFISFGRENYDGLCISIPDMVDFLAYSGFWRFARHNIESAMRELKTVLSTTAFVHEAARYVPSLADVEVEPAVRGIRAQAMEADGSLVDDFIIRHQGRVTHVRNAPSPGATSSLAIAEYIVRVLMPARGTLAA